MVVPYLGPGWLFGLLICYYWPVSTARIRRMTEGNIFSLFTPSGGEEYPCPAIGRYPNPRSGWGRGVPPSCWWGGVGNIPSQARGYPHPDLGWAPCPGQVPGQDGGGGSSPNQNSMVCTCYAAGGMPLAFTQEDFLVKSVFLVNFWYCVSLPSWQRVSFYVISWEKLILRLNSWMCVN